MEKWIDIKPYTIHQKEENEKILVWYINKDRSVVMVEIEKDSWYQGEFTIKYNRRFLDGFKSKTAAIKEAKKWLEDFIKEDRN